MLWENLSKVANLHGKPWIIVGDFNEPLVGAEKFGGRPISINRSRLRTALINVTWWIWVSVGLDISGRIEGRSVSHLTRCHSNHCPVLMETNPKRQLHLTRPFKFQSFWLSDPSFPSVVSQAWHHPRKLMEAIEAFSN